MTKKKELTKVYDDSNAKKGGIGVHLEYSTHPQFSNLAEPFSVKSRLFPEGYSYKFKRIDGDKWLEILDGDGNVCFHIPRQYVITVGGPEWLFRDAEWK